MNDEEKKQESPDGEELQAELERLKLAEQGLNRRVSQVEKERDEYKTKFETLQGSRSDKEAQVLEYAKEVLSESRKLELVRMAIKEATEKGIGFDLALEAIEEHNNPERLGSLFEKIENEVKGRTDAEILKRFGNAKPPKGGDSPQPKLEDMTDQMIKRLSDNQFEAAYEDQQKRLKPKTKRGWLE